MSFGLSISTVEKRTALTSSVWVFHFAQWKKKNNNTLTSSVRVFHFAQWKKRTTLTSSVWVFHFAHWKIKPLLLIHCESGSFTLQKNNCSYSVIFSLGLSFWHTGKQQPPYSVTDTLKNQAKVVFKERSFVRGLFT